MSALTIRIDDRRIRDLAAKVRADARVIGPATEEALTVVAQRARKDERAMLKAQLDRAKGFTINSVGIRKARPVSDGYESAVIVLARMEDILARLEYGGRTRRGLGVADLAYTNRYGSVGKRGIAKALREPNTFTAEIKGTKGIYQRTGRKLARRRVIPGPRGGRRANVRELKLLIAFLPRAQYDPQIDFRDTALVLAADSKRGVEAEIVRQLGKRMRTTYRP